MSASTVKWDIDSARKWLRQQRVITRCFNCGLPKLPTPKTRREWSEVVDDTAHCYSAHCDSREVQIQALDLARWAFESMTRQRIDAIRKEPRP